MNRATAVSNSGIQIPPADHILMLSIESSRGIPDAICRIRNSSPARKGFGLSGLAAYPLVRSVNHGSFGDLPVNAPSVGSCFVVRLETQYAATG